MQLPDPISSWTEILSYFPEDIADLMTGLVNHLSRLIDSMPMVEDQGLAEPDGLDGLGRIVQYERLLSSEWLLQEEVPEEFIRRVVAGEHFFYQLKRIENRERHCCYALFDCGPDQLGKPRLVQLAMLILLARRAERNRSSFIWGVLQDEKKTLFHGVTRDSIARWLDRRSIELPSQVSLDDWLDVFSKEDKALRHFENSESIGESELVEDFWLVSRAGLDLSKVRARQVFIEEPFDEVGRIVVGVSAKGFSRQISLRLPREELNVKVIRNPFVSMKKYAGEPVSDLGGRWGVSPNGRFLGFCSDGREVLVLGVDVNSKKSSRNFIFSVPDGQSCLGMFLTKKRHVFFCADRDHFYIHNYPFPGQVKKIVRRQSVQVPEGRGSLLDAVVSRAEGGSESLYVLDSKGHLRVLDISSGQTLFETKSHNVIALGAVVACDYYVAFDRERSKLTFFWYLSSYKVSSKSFYLENGHKIPKIHVSGSGDWRKGVIGCAAIETSENVWIVITGNKEKKVTVQNDDAVIGVWSGLYDSASGEKSCRSGSGGRCVLLVIKPDRRTLCGVDQDGEMFLSTLASDFIKGEVNPRHPFLHYIDGVGELVVFDILKDCELLRWEGVGQS